ncbi:hypothetical protein UN63_08230 [Oceanisphaera arctica]|uniref:Uncharacterized protein n=1 Tax=Oceanisphaera arctica TaxID=641510 RepID=A0A2P5TM69_9GAMM|nr:hypothetical protein UN63_08230 [Oceanisphaera arctica]
MDQPTAEIGEFCLITPVLRLLSGAMFLDQILPRRGVWSNKADPAIKFPDLAGKYPPRGRSPVFFPGCWPIKEVKK